MMVENYNPDSDGANLKGKVVVVTGGTSGVGKAFILLAAPYKPAQIIFTGRSDARAQEVIKDVKSLAKMVDVDFVKMDLGDLNSVRGGAVEINKLASHQIDILVNNAGVGFIPPGLTKQGYELVFGTNHLGHFALTQLLLPALTRAAQRNHLSDARIVDVSSLAAVGMVPKEGILFDKLDTPLDNLGIMANGMRYGHSKLANHLFTLGLAERYPNITTTTVHPGLVATEGSNNLPYVLRFIMRLRAGAPITPRQGAYNVLWAAATKETPKAQRQGGWFVPVGMAGPPIPPQSLAQSTRLWDWSEKVAAENGV